MDRAGFDAEMAEQRARARRAARTPAAADEAAYRALLEADGATEFVGPGSRRLRRASRVVGDPGRDRAGHGRGVLGPQSLLRRERGPGGRHRHHRDRDRPGRGLRDGGRPARPPTPTGPG